MTPNWQKKIGQWGENLGKAYLVEHGYQIIECNARTSHGELDIVAYYLNEIHFIEVKTRTNQNLGYPESSITSRKRQHMINSAQSYIQQHPEFGENWHIDVIAISGSPGQMAPQVMYFENAIE